MMGASCVRSRACLRAPHTEQQEGNHCCCTAYRHGQRGVSLNGPQHDGGGPRPLRVHLQGSWVCMLDTLLMPGRGNGAQPVSCGVLCSVASSEF